MKNAGFNITKEQTKTIVNPENHSIMRLVHLYKKTEILKYWIADYNDPLDYMRAAMAAIQ